MKFGAVPIKEALGATAVHSIRQGDLVLKKGTLIGPKELAALERAGVKEIVVARVEAGDVSEDQAAAGIAAAVAGASVRADRAFTGRCNLFAESAGVLVVDKEAIDRLNRIDEAVTIGHAPRLQAGGGRRDDRHRQDHSLCGCGKRARRRGGRGGQGQARHPHRALQGAQGRRGVDAIARAVAQGGRQDAEDYDAAHCTRRRGDHCGKARAARAGSARQSDRRGAGRRRRTGDRIRRFGDRGSPRRHPGGAGGGRRQHRAFRHAGRSRQSHADRASARAGGARRAGLRAQPEGKRLRLGADAAAWPACRCRAPTLPAWASAAC